MPWRSILLLCSVTLEAVAVSVLAYGEGLSPPWIVIALGAMVPLLGESKKRLDSARPATGTTEQPHEPPLRLAKAQPQDFGLSDAGDLPTYVRRDTHSRLEEALASTEHRGGLIILVGGPASGRSRLAYEVLTHREHLADLALYRPPALGALLDQPRLPGRSVIWIDDLFAFLEGERGLTRQALIDLRPAIVIGTIWPEELQQLASEAALENAWRVEVPSRFSIVEQEIAHSVSRTDPVVRQAWQASSMSANAEFGMTQTLAFAPQLRQRWENARLAEKAVLTAALDAARLGVRSALQPSFLGAASVGYLTSAENTFLGDDPNWLSDALQQASSPVRLGSRQAAPLTRVAESYYPSAYLRQIVIEERAREPLPKAFWIAASRYLDDASELRALSRAADRRGQDEEARMMAYAARDRGDTFDAVSLADLLIEQAFRLKDLSRYAEAEAALRPIVKTHVPARGPYAEALMSLDRTSELPSFWQQFTDLQARLSLATALESLGRQDEAVAVLQELVANGHLEALTPLSLLLTRMDRDDDVDKLWIAQGPAGLRQVAIRRIEDGDYERAEQLLVQAIAEGVESHDARSRLANLYEAQGNYAGAVQVLRDGLGTAPSLVDS